MWTFILLILALFSLEISALSVSSCENIAYAWGNPEHCKLDWKDEVIAAIKKNTRHSCSEVRGQSTQVPDNVVAEIKKRMEKLKEIPNPDESYPNIEFLRGGNLLVLSFKDLPDWVLKLKLSCFSAISEARIERTKEAEKVIKENCLDLLHVPAYRVIDVLLGPVGDKKKCQILIEKRLKGSSDFSHQEDLYLYIYELFEHYPWLLDYFKELFRQLTIFLCKTNVDDVKFNNFPLASDGRGIWLIDVDTWGSGIQQLLAMASPLLYDTILKAAAECRKQPIEKIADTKWLNNQRISMENQVKSHAAYRNWRISRHIQQGDEPILNLAQGLGTLSPLEKAIVSQLAEIINEQIKKNASQDVSIKGKRTIAIWVAPSDFPKAQKLAEKSMSAWDFIKILREFLIQKLPHSDAVFKVQEEHNFVQVVV